MLKRMSDYTYHCGLQLRIYPSDRQKQIIRRNAGASRFVYNRLVATDRERSRLKKSAHLCPPDRDRPSYLNVVRSSMSAFCAAAPLSCGAGNRFRHDTAGKDGLLCRMEELQRGRPRLSDISQEKECILLQNEQPLQPEKNRKFSLPVRPVRRYDPLWRQKAYQAAKDRTYQIFRLKETDPETVRCIRRNQDRLCTDRDG